MNYRSRTLATAAFLFLLAIPLLGKYKIKPIEPKPAADYKCHLDFQNVVIGAFAATNEKRVLELFDEKKIHKKKILPVLIVIENNNDFAIRLHERDIYLVRADGTNVSALPVGEAFLSVVLKKTPSENPAQASILLNDYKKSAMLADFQHKHFDERMIAPFGSDYGVVFFPLPEPDQRQGLRLYLPEVENVTTGQELIFFEIDLE